MEEPVHEVAADTKLGVGGPRIAHRGEQAGLQAMESVPLPLREVAAAEEPLFALDSSLLAMTVVAQREVAMGDEIRNGYFGGRGGRPSGGRLELHRTRNLC